MTPAAEIVRYLVERRFQVALDDRGESIVIRPAPSAALLDRLRPHKPNLLAYLREHHPVSSHRYVIWSGARDREQTMCLSCGVPPNLHGSGALDDPLELDNPNDAVLLEACAIVAAAATRQRQTRWGEGWRR